MLYAVRCSVALGAVGFSRFLSAGVQMRRVLVTRTVPAPNWSFSETFDSDLKPLPAIP